MVLVLNIMVMTMFCSHAMNVVLEHWRVFYLILLCFLSNVRACCLLTHECPDEVVQFSSYGLHLLQYD